MAKRLIDSAELIAKLPVVDEDKQISLIGAVSVRFRGKRGRMVENNPLRKCVKRSGIAP